jgi:hypothetical protein
MCAPGVATAGVAVAQAGIGYLGARQQTSNNNRAIRASNRARIANYNYQIQQQNREWNNTLKIWDQRIDQYNKQIQRNNDAAYGYGGAYMGLQVQTNEKFREAAFQAQDSFVKLNQVLGTAQATGQSGKTADRFDVASLGAFGREQALRASNLTSSIDKQKLDQTNVRRQLENANNQAYQSVAVAPVPGMRPMAPQLSSMQSTNATPFIAQGALGAFTGLGKGGFFGQGIQNAFLPGIKDPLQVS